MLFISFQLCDTGFVCHVARCAVWDPCLGISRVQHGSTIFLHHKLTHHRRTIVAEKLEAQEIRDHCSGPMPRAARRHYAQLGEAPCLAGFWAHKRPL